MNFLAHLWLAERTGTSLAGAVLGDVVRGADLSAYPPALALGIQLHRRVDATTDRHPALHPLRARFAPGRRRYAGIVLDLVTDHVLARDWRALETEPLTAFCARAGQAIAEAAPWFLQAGGRRTTAGDFTRLLLSYRDPAGIDLALGRVASRLRQPALLLDAARDWQALMPALSPVVPGLLRDIEAQLQAVMPVATQA